MKPLRENRPNFDVKLLFDEEKLLWNFRTLQREEKFPRYLNLDRKIL
jgi:hypothetical protein